LEGPGFNLLLRLKTGWMTIADVNSRGACGIERWFVVRSDDPVDSGELLGECGQRAVFGLVVSNWWRLAVWANLVVKIIAARNATCMKQTLNERDDEGHREAGPWFKSKKGGKR